MAVAVARLRNVHAERALRDANAEYADMHLRPGVTPSAVRVSCTTCRLFTFLGCRRPSGYPVFHGLIEEYR